MDTAVQTPAGYEDDEHAWLLEQAALLAAGHTAQIDREHLSEFLTDMARRDRREVRSRLLVLMTHILKCIAQPERVSRSWILTILTQQHELRETIRESRSLAAVAAELVPELARSAAELAAIETQAFIDSVPPNFDLAFVLSLAPELAPHPASPDAR